MVRHDPSVNAATETKYDVKRRLAMRGLCGGMAAHGDSEAEMTRIAIEEIRAAVEARECERYADDDFLPLPLIKQLD